MPRQKFSISSRHVHPPMIILSRNRNPDAPPCESACKAAFSMFRKLLMLPSNPQIRQEVARMANHKHRRHQPHQGGVEDIEVPLMITEVAMHPNNKFDEPGNRSDQNDDAGGVDDAEEQPPVPLSRQRHSL